MHSSPPVFLKLLEKSSGTTPRKNAPSLVSIPVDVLRQWIEEYIDDCWARGMTERTIGDKREVLGKLLWFFDNHHIGVCDSAALLKLFVYLRRGQSRTAGALGQSAPAQAAFAPSRRALLRFAANVIHMAH